MTSTCVHSVGSPHQPWGFHTTRLKMIVSEAITDGIIITADPFAGYEAEKPQREQKFLTSEELQRIMTTPLHDSRLYHVRDLFLFSCYTGIPYGDICLLTEDNLETAEDGTVWIRSSRKRRRWNMRYRCLSCR